MNKLLISLLVIGIFLLYYCMLLGVVTPIVRYSVDNSSFFLFNLLCCLSSLVVLYFVHGKKSFLKTLGLEKNLGKGLLLGFVSTLPLFIYSIVYGTWNIELTCWRLVNATLFAGFLKNSFLEEYCSVSYLGMQMGIYSCRAVDWHYLWFWPYFSRK